MILVVGDVMTDVIVRLHGPAAPGTDQPATITRRPGGSGANIACWLGRHGIATSFAGRVGAADGQAHRDAFARNGVRVRLGADAERDTGSTIAVVADDGERSFFTDRGANLGLCGSDLPDHLLDGARALHVSGHVFFAPGPREAARSLMRRAVDAGVAVSVDAGSAGWLRDHGPARFRDWTAAASLCIANRAEADLLGGGWDVFVVTDGAAGAELRRRGGVVRAASPAVADLVDGIGAGDAFTAGFLAARLDGATDAACLAQGCAWAARCLGQAGGRPGE